MCLRSTSSQLPQSIKHKHVLSWAGPDQPLFKPAEVMFHFGLFPFLRLGHEGSGYFYSRRALPMLTRHTRRSCNPNRQCCETLARFYVPAEMSPSAISAPWKMTTTHKHTHTRSKKKKKKSHVRIKVLATQTSLEGFADPGAEVVILCRVRELKRRFFRWKGKNVRLRPG